MLVCFISHQGEVFPCGYLPVKAGDLRRQNFAEIWEQSPVFAALRDPDNDWATDSRDLVDTWGAGINASLWKNKLIFDGFYGLSVAKGLIRSRNLGVPTLTFATAVDFPNASNRFHQLVSSVKVRLPKNFWPRFEYRYEKYGRADFQTENISPFMGSVDPVIAGQWILLGADVPGYNVHIFAVSLEYLF